MSEPCSTRAYTLLVIFMLSAMSPMVSADPAEEPTFEPEEFVPVFADLDDFTPTGAHPYMIPDSNESLYSLSLIHI